MEINTVSNASPIGANSTIKMFHKLPDLTIQASNIKNKARVQVLPTNVSLNMEKVSDSCRNQHESLKDELEKKNREIETLQDRIAKIKAKYSDYHQRLEQTVEALVSKNAELKSATEKRDLEFQAVNLRLLEVFIAKNAIANTNSKLIADKEDLKKVIASLENAKSQIELNNLKQREIFSIEIKTINANFEKWMLLGQETELLLNEKCKDFDKVRVKYDEVNVSNLKKDAVILAKNSEALEQSKFFMREIKKLETKLETYGARCSGLEIKTQGVETNLKEKTIKMEILQSKCMGLEKLLEEQNSTHKNKCAEFQNTINQLETKAKMLEEELSEVKKSNKNLEDGHNRIKKEKEELETTLRETATKANRNKYIYLHKIQKIVKLWQQKKQQRNEKLQEISAEAKRMREQLVALKKAKSYLNAVIENKKRSVEPSQSQDYVVSSTIPVVVEPTNQKRKFSCEDYEEKTQLVKKACRKSRAVSTLEQTTTETFSFDVELITLSDSEDF